MPTIKVVYWRDMPAQIKVGEAQAQVKRMLPPRFQVAIGEAAMRAGLIGSEAYLAQWRFAEWPGRDGELEAVATAVYSELEASYPPARLRTLIKHHGLETGPGEQE